MMSAKTTTCGHDERFFAPLQNISLKKGAWVMAFDCENILLPGVVVRAPSKAISTYRIRFDGYSAIEGTEEVEATWVMGYNTYKRKADEDVEKRQKRQKPEMAALGDEDDDVELDSDSDYDSDDSDDDSDDDPDWIVWCEARATSHDKTKALVEQKDAAADARIRNPATGTLPPDHLTRAQLRALLTKSVRAPVEGHESYVSRPGGDWHTSQLIGRARQYNDGDEDYGNYNINTVMKIPMEALMEVRTLSVSLLLAVSHAGLIFTCVFP